jgi:hypothetical protein
LIILREIGLSRGEPWDRFLPVVEHVRKSGDEDFMLNKLIEITGVGRFTIRELPEPRKRVRKSKYALASGG